MEVGDVDIDNTYGHLLSSTSLVKYFIKTWTQDGSELAPVSRSNRKLSSLCSVKTGVIYWDTAPLQKELKFFNFPKNKGDFSHKNEGAGKIGGSRGKK